MKQLLTFSVMIAFGLMLNFGQAQTAYEPITAENVSQITQVERLGNGVVHETAFLADETRFAVATTLGVWLIDLSDTANGRLLEGQHGVWSVEFSPDGKWGAGGGDDGSVMVWDAATGEQVARLENHLYPISAVAWAADGGLLASGDWSGVARVWDATTWSEYRVFAREERIDQLIFDDTDALTAFGEESRTAWDIASGEVVSQSEAIGGVGDEYGERQAEWLPDAGQIEIWEDGERIAVLDGFYGELGGVSFTDDGRVGARPLAEGHLWSLESRELDNAAVPVVSPDGTRMASFGNDGVIRLTDMASGEQIAALHGHIRKVNAAAYSPHGSLLASVSDDGTIQIWDATVTEDSGSLLTLEGHTSGVTDVAFNADGTLIASTGYDGTVRLWGIGA